MLFSDSFCIFYNFLTLIFISLDDIDETSAEYANWLKQHEELETFEIEQIKKNNEEEQQKWLHAEMIAMEQWRRLQEQKEVLRQQRLEQEDRLKMVIVVLQGILKTC